jgi:hypothetical protein
MPAGITEGFEEREHSAHPGSAGCQLAFVGSLLTKFVFGRLPNTAGKLPALPGRERQHLQQLGNLHGVQRCAFQQLIARNPESESIFKRAIAPHSADFTIVFSSNL